MTRQTSQSCKRVTNNLVEKLSIAIFFSGFFFMMAGWMLFTIPSRYRAEVDFRSRALLTSGVVTKKNQKTTYAGSIVGLAPYYISTCEVEVEFKSSKGIIVEFRDSCYKSVTENQAVPVLYDPAHCGKARIDRGDSPDSRATNDLVTSLVCALFGSGPLICIFLDRRNQTQT